ncbi:TMC domain protein [Streptomyces azureus]|uniref:TMC domain protein n=1 Tax=Streptomyces azureus TaxID=146537 RepID=A0A0K8PZS5_STRAJ|nr:TMC domain protein [Streptomyces azureus]
MRTPQDWPVPTARARHAPIDRSQQARRVGTQQVPTLPRNHADREPARADRELRGPDWTYR